jgi:TonB family protein
MRTRALPAALAALTLIVSGTSIVGAAPPPVPPAAGRVDREAGPLRRVVAPYPEEVQRVNAEAVVIARLHPDGRVASSSLDRSSTMAGLDDAAQTAVENTRFAPAVRNCVAYSSTPVVTVPFAGGGDTLKTAAECAQGDAVLRSLARPADPGSPARRRERGSLTVIVTVEPDGRVSATDLLWGSGSRRLDREGLRIARGSRYAAGADEDCVPVQSTYTLELTFR